MAVFSAFTSGAGAGRKRWMTMIGYSLVAIGGLGFFGAGLSSVGGLTWLPNSFEWPAGFVRHILVMPDGKHVVPHTPSGRIQVYDPTWKFLRGWHVDASGGVFKLRLASSNQIEVITARGQMRYVYGIDGNLHSQATYKPQSYSDFPVSDESAAVPTPWWLWMFTSPVYSWIIGASGMALLFLLDRSKLKRKVKKSS